MAVYAESAEQQIDQMRCRTIGRKGVVLRLIMVQELVEMRFRGENMLLARALVPTTGLMRLVRQRLLLLNFTGITAKDYTADRPSNFQGRRIAQMHLQITKPHQSG